jgi:hypothetical protein
MGADSRLSWDELDESAGATVLTTSGLHLPGLVVKRTVAERSTDMVVAPQDTHVVVVHDSAALNLQWREGRRIHNSFLPPGYVIVNPAGYSERRGWDKRSEDVRAGVALDSPYLGSSGSRLRPAVAVRDPLLAQLGRYLARTFEMGRFADSLYADALAHALGAHLVEHYSARRSGMKSPQPSPTPTSSEPRAEAAVAGMSAVRTGDDIAALRRKLADSLACWRYGCPVPLLSGSLPHVDLGGHSMDL